MITDTEREMSNPTSSRASQAEILTKIEQAVQGYPLADIGAAATCTVAQFIILATKDKREALQFAQTVAWRIEDIIREEYDIHKNWREH